MRSNLHRLFALALCLALTAGCGTAAAPVAVPQDAPVQSAPIETVDDTAAMIPALAYDPNYSVNPFTTRSQTNRVFLPLCYESLFQLADDFTASPLLCQNLSISDDEKAYTLTLRSGVLFTDGTPLRAQDVIYSLQTAAATDYFGSRLRRMTGISADVSGAITITLSTPYSNFAALLDVPIVKEGTANAAVPVGTGAYRLSVSDSGGRLTHQNSWWNDAPTAFSDSDITLLPLANAEDLRTAFEQGQLGMVCLDPNENRYVYHCDFELWNCPTTLMEYLGFNSLRNLFSDATLRKAVTLAIDRETLTKTYYGSFAMPATLPASPLAACYDQTLAAQYAYDADACAKLLAGKDLSDEGIFLVCSEQPLLVDTAQWICEQLRALGFQLTVRAVGRAAYDSALQNGNFDLYLGMVRLTADFDLSSFFSGSLSYGGLANQDAAALCRSALENSGNYYDLHRKVMGDGLLCPLLLRDYAVYAARGQFSALTPAAGNVFAAAKGG
ncbi:MAG: ABC transporter substrate-binding protein [Oscillospiraceae bacterium]|nr:ABC transporter substrate-binding protein [Oscillospiraceae bacterium]